MKLQSVLFVSLILSVAGVGTTGCGAMENSNQAAKRQEQTMSESGAPKPEMTKNGEQVKEQSLLQVLKQEETFSTLVAAVNAAGLAETLSGASAFTIFAPTNEAFAKLPTETLTSLLKPENKEELKSILLYHVASGELKAAQVLQAKAIASAQGDELTIDAANLKVNNAKIQKADFLFAKNGVVHTIDTVLIPTGKKSKVTEKSSPTVAGIVEADPNFSTLLAALKAADLVGVLNGSSKYTVFAPTNAAFASLPSGTLDSLLKPENKAKLADILLYHVVPGSFPASAVLKTNILTSASSKPLPIDAEKVTIAGASLVKTDIAAANGIVHVIDKVMIPAAEPAQSLAEVVATDSRFSTLNAALKAADLASVLAGNDAFTVFAPTNDAFAALPQGTIEFLLQPSNKMQLQTILLQHVVFGSLFAADVLNAMALTSQAGSCLKVDAQAGTVGGSKILETNIRAVNGVVHVIDRVIVTP